MVVHVASLGRIMICKMQMKNVSEQTSLVCLFLVFFWYALRDKLEVAKAHRPPRSATFRKKLKKVGVIGSLQTMLSAVLALTCASQVPKGTGQVGGILGTELAGDVDDFLIGPV